ncbi:MAG: T9SS type A sorting domain-containing protein [Flavobacteriales bacterium]|nr:MAG: T9SS type A sorting domain-containing protein [Flavobacteriales bacterium]
MSRTPRLLLPVLLLAAHGATGQWTPAANAVKLPDSLIFTSTGANSNATVVWHPVKARYYSLRPGNAAFPLETWVAGSSTSVCTATAGIDSRGMWYNPATNTIERNCFGALGWATFGIDAASCATGASTIIFPGQLQATVQSCSAFDPVLGEVLSYAAATTSVQFRSRATGALVQTLVLTGTSFANVNTESIIWTGQVGYEIGLLDYVAKRVLLFNRATGAFTGQSQLPASAVTHSQFRFCYTNNRVWLFTATTRKWNAYCIWNQGCPITVLPVELVDFRGECAGGTPQLQWSTASERNSSHFTVQRSAGVDAWEDVGEAPAAGDSQALLHYHWTDPQPRSEATVLYRLRQVDRDGTSEVFDAVTVHCQRPPAELLAYPNPATDRVWLQLPEGTAEHSIDVLDLRGCIQYTRRSSANDTIDPIDLSGLGRGAYVLVLRAPQGAVLGRAVVTKE